jgi:hypothetical protein
LIGHGTAAIPHGTRGFAPGARYTVDNGDGTSTTYKNMGDASGSAMVDTAGSTELESFTVVHNPNIGAVSTADKDLMVAIFDMNLNTECIGSCSTRANDGGFQFGDKGSVMILRSLPAKGGFLIVKDKTITTEPTVHLKVLGGRLGMLVADMAGTEDLLVSAEDGQAQFVVTHDSDAAAHPQVYLSPGEDEGSYLFTTGVSLLERVYIRDVGGQEIEIDAQGGVDPSWDAIYVDEAEVDARYMICADNTIDPGENAPVAMIGPGAQNTGSGGAVALQMYFDDDAVDGQGLMHDTPQVPLTLLSPIKGSNRFVPVSYNPNASTLGVPVYVNKNTQDMEADLPGEEDAVFKTSKVYAPYQDVTVV